MSPDRKRRLDRGTAGPSRSCAARSPPPGSCREPRYRRAARERVLHRAGHFAHKLADRTGITPEFFGKPFRNIFDIAFERVGNVDRDRVVMVGDSLHTDILGAQSAGIASALIANYGFFAGLDAEGAVAASGIVPDFIVERP
ncbi:MAG: HAD-IA family hydrolase [Paracoccaceae bacterium]